MAIEYNGTKPAFEKGIAFGFVNAYHPLLLLKNQKEGKETVPFNFTLHPPNKILLLSGPNAGGKSILMKAVGLIQLMLQSGMLVPVDPSSSFAIYQKLFVEIGDQQSIENELSTYSGRLQKMKQILQGADKNSLLLIDEFGSGTDPKLGAAMAESLLRALNKKSIAGVITTHYSNLKAFAFKSKGIVNGAMVFDKTEMVPTYQLSIGRPGSSFTFEIATNSGLDEKLIRYARQRSGKAHQALEDLLLDLEKKKSDLAKHLSSVEAKERKLDQLIRNYDQMSKELDIQRKRLKLKKKEATYQEVSEAKKEMDKMLREMRAKVKAIDTSQIRLKKENRSKPLVKEMEQNVAAVKEKVSEIQEDVVALQDAVSEVVRADIKLEDLKAGSYVRLQDAQTIGQIQSIDKQEAFVTFGDLTMRVKLKKLIPTKPPIEVKSTKTQVKEVKKEQRFNSKLDIRGMRLEEANGAVQQFMDEALLNNSLRVHIVHGKGTGALRKLVHQKLREYTISRYFHPEEKEGGDGATIIEI